MTSVFQGLSLAPGDGKKRTLGKRLLESYTIWVRSLLIMANRTKILYIVHIIVVPIFFYRWYTGICVLDIFPNFTTLPSPRLNFKTATSFLWGISDLLLF